MPHTPRPQPEMRGGSSCSQIFLFLPVYSYPCENFFPEIFLDFFSESLSEICESSISNKTHHSTIPAFLFLVLEKFFFSDPLPIRSIILEIGYSSVSFSACGMAVSWTPKSCHTFLAQLPGHPAVIKGRCERKMMGTKIKKQHPAQQEANKESNMMTHMLP